MTPTPTLCSAYTHAMHPPAHTKRGRERPFHALRLAGCRVDRECLSSWDGHGMLWIARPGLNIDPNPNLGSRVSATDDRMRYAWLVLVQEAI